MTRTRLFRCSVCGKLIKESLLVGQRVCSRDCFSKLPEPSEAAKHPRSLVRVDLKKKRVEFKKSDNSTKKFQTKKQKRKRRIAELVRHNAALLNEISELRRQVVIKKAPTSQNSFYLSYEWRRVRYEAIKKYGRACMACGNTTGPAHVDHIKPRSKFPELELDIANLQILCEACNMGKSNKFSDDWRPKI